MKLTLPPIMKMNSTLIPSIALVAVFSLAFATLAQTPPNQRPGDGGFPPDRGPGFDGPPPFGPGGGFGPGGPGGPGGMMQETKLVKQFDQDGDKRLNNEERKAAREYLTKERANRGPGGPGSRRGGFGPRGEMQEPAQPGQKISPADVKSFPDAPAYDLTILRTFFLEFENSDWEKELADFINTDVEVPAKLTVDGKVYQDVGVHFRGMSSLMMVPEGRKRSLNLSLDWVHEKQNLGGYRTFNLLNSHGDPTMLRAVLSHRISREYLPAPQANFVRVVINGEDWGVYASAQQFNKDFINDWFGTTKGARWKVPGSPQGRAGLEYLGEDPAPYKRLYEIKTKDDPAVWADLIKLCKVLNQTPADQLEQALAPLLDVDGVLKFLALENVLVNTDGYWVRASDYSLYQDTKGRFHLFPHDANETFSSGGGPGGPGGPGRFGPEMIVPQQMLEQADQNDDGQLTKLEFSALAETWFTKLDPDKTGKVSQEQFIARIEELLPPPQGFGPPGGAPQGTQRPGGGRGGFGPAMFLGPALFGATDTNKDGLLTRAELKDTFAQWFSDWDTGKRGALSEDDLRTGLATVLPQPSFAGPGGPEGGRGRGGPGGGPGGGGGVQLDPLVAANDASKPLLSKLLAVPALRSRYLGYVREIAETWLDWNKLGPLAKEYQSVIADAVKVDTRKLDSTEAFFAGLDGAPQSKGGFGPGRGQRGSLKSFAEQRRQFLLNHAEVRKFEQ